MLGTLAVTLAMRRSWLEEQKLPFPSGVATAELIGALHERAGEARARTLAVAAAFAFGAVIVLLRDGPWHALPSVIAPTFLLGALAAGVKKVIFAGSGGTLYGVPEHLPVREGHPQAPLAPYGVSKKAVGDYLHYYREVRGLEYTVLALANVYGPRQDPHGEAGVIAIFAGLLLEQERPTIYGDGEQTRDFTYVANVVDGVLRACDAPAASGEIINVATGGRISLNQLFAAMRGLIGASVEPAYTDPRPGDVRDSQADISKAKRLLGYEPTVSFEEGLRRTVEWYRTAGATTTSA